MPDDERPRRRLGDETKNRIADLASGWSLDGKDEVPPPAPAHTPTPQPAGAKPPPLAGAKPPPPAGAKPPTTPPPVREKRRTNPPPPPGSAERKALEDKIIEAARPAGVKTSTSANPVAGEARPKSPSAPPPPRSSSPGTVSSTPPPGQPMPRPGTRSGPQFKRAEYSGPAAPFVTEARTPAVIVDDSITYDAIPEEDDKRPNAISGMIDLSAKSKSPTKSASQSSESSGQIIVEASKPASSARSRGPLVVEPSKPVSRPDESSGVIVVEASKPASSARSRGPLVVAPSKPVSRPDESSGVLVVAPSKPVSRPDESSGVIVVASSKPVARADDSSGEIVIAPSKPRESRRSSGPVAAEPSKPNPARASRPSAAPIGAEPSKPLAFPLPPPDRSTPRVASPVAPPTAASNPKLTVPVGEFDSGVQTIEQETMRRDAAEALLDIPDKVVPVEDLLEDDDEDEDDDEVPGRGDPTTIDPLTAKFERGDPTTDGGPDATTIEPPSRQSQHSGGTLRPSAALRRKRGLAGDVRYVFTAMFGVRRSRRELAELEHRQSLRQTSRRRHLITLGRAAVITDSFDHPALGKAREQLQAIEDERSRHSGAVSASDAELERVRRDRENKVKQFAIGISETDAELAELAKKLAPLEKEAAAARKRGQELRESLQRIDKKLADTETLLTSVKGEKLDKAQVLSDIATLKADRQSVLRDEPAIAAELDALNPRIAAMEGARNELRKKRIELEKSEVEDQRRALELLEAIGAKRKVVERAASDAEAARDNALFELGERLYVDRPKTLAAQLSPIDQIDLELGEGDRRAMELKEIISNVDKAKFARGLAMIILVAGVAGSLLWLLLSALL